MILISVLTQSNIQIDTDDEIFNEKLSETLISNTNLLKSHYIDKLLIAFKHFTSNSFLKKAQKTMENLNDVSLLSKSKVETRFYAGRKTEDSN